MIKMWFIEIQDVFDSTHNTCFWNTITMICYKITQMCKKRKCSFSFVWWICLSSVFPPRSILHPRSGLVWLLCQQGQDPRLQGHHRTSVERSQSPTHLILLLHICRCAIANIWFSSSVSVSFKRSLRLSWRAPSTCGSCATRSATTKACSTRTTTRLWTRSWEKGKSR